MRLNLGRNLTRLQENKENAWSATFSFLSKTHERCCIQCNFYIQCLKNTEIGRRHAVRMKTRCCFFLKSSLLTFSIFCISLFTEDACRSSQDKKMCTKLQSVSQQLRDLQQEHQQTMADMRLLVTSMARLQKEVKLSKSVSVLLPQTKV